MAFLDKVTSFLHHDEEVQPPAPPKHEHDQESTDGQAGGLERNARDALDESVRNLQNTQQRRKKRMQLPEIPEQTHEQSSQNPIDVARTLPRLQEDQPVGQTDQPPADDEQPSGQATKRAMKKLLADPDASAPDAPMTAPRLEPDPAQDASDDVQAPRTPSHEPADHTFHLHGGETVDSLKQLAKACKRMSPQVWDHHVSDQRNDFADWIKHNYSQELAYQATQCDNPFELYVALSKHGAAEREPALEDSLSQLKRELSQIREDISQQLEEELATVEQQEERLAELREDVKREQEAFRKQEQALKQEVERLQQEQAMFEETIKRVEQQNKQLFEEHEAAKQTHEEVARLRLQLRDEHEELKQAKQVVQEHLAEQSAHPEQGDLLDLVAQVRKDIEHERWEAARQGYRKVSRLFDEADLEDELRREVYNLIRGLYADIHLHAISE